MNKLTKLLSVFVIAGAIGTGVAGAVGCNNTDPNPDGPGDTTHTHQTWSTTGTDNGNGTHKLTCTTEGCTETKNEDHKDVDEDDVCDVCEAELDAATDPNAVASVAISAAKEELEAGEEITLTAKITPATAPQTVTWSITSGDSLATIDTATGKLKIKDTSTSGGEVIVKATSTATTTKSDTKKFTIAKQTKFHELKADTENNLIADDFATAKDLTEFSGTYGTKGLYAWGNNAAIPAGSKGKVAVANGVAKITTGTTGASDSKPGNMTMVADFGTVKDVIEGYVELQPTAVGNDWAIFSLVGTSATVTDNKEVFSIHTANSTGDLDYRLDGTAVAAKEAITLKAGTPHKIYYKLNLVTGEITATVNDKVICENVKTGITSVAGAVIITSNSGQREVIIDNFAVNSVALSATDVAADLKESVAALNTAAVALKGTAWTSSATEDALSSAKTTADTALDATDVTKDGALSAYATYESAVYDALAVEYLARLQAKYPATDYTTEGTETGVDENKVAYANAITAATTAFGAVDSLDGFAEVLAAQDTIIDAIFTNSELIVAKVTITLYDAENAEIGKLTGLLDGSKLTLDKIKKAITTTKKIGKIYTTNTDGTLSGEVTGDYTVTAKEEGGEKVDTPDAKLYVELADWQTAGLDFAAIKAEADKTEGSGITKDKNGRVSISSIYGSEDEAVSGLLKCEAFELTDCTNGVELGTDSYSPDGTAAAQTYTFLKPSGNTGSDKPYTVVAKKDMVLIVTYNTGDGSNNGGKKGKLMYQIGKADAVTVDVETSSKTQVYTAEIELKAGETIILYSSGSRLMLLDLDAKY